MLWENIHTPGRILSNNVKVANKNTSLTIYNLLERYADRTKRYEHDKYENISGFVYWACLWAVLLWKFLLYCLSRLAPGWLQLIIYSSECIIFNTIFNFLNILERILQLSNVPWSMLYYSRPKDKQYIWQSECKNSGIKTIWRHRQSRRILAWLSSLVVIPKSNGDIQICVDISPSQPSHRTRKVRHT